MRKILLMFAVLAAMVFTGCSNDKNNDTGSDELAGTKWMTEEGRIGSSYYWAEGIQFNSASSFTYFYYQMNNLDIVDEGEASGWYIYNPPIVTGNATMDGVKVSIRGIINDDTMTIYIDNEEYGVYKKQNK